MPNESYEIKALNPHTNEVSFFTARHEENWSSRNGYQPNFLGTEVKLPSLDHYANGEELAKNPNPGSNGETVLDYSNFSIVFNKAKKLPVYTAVNISGPTNSLAMVHEQRGSDKWYQDDRIKQGDNTFQYSDSDYRGSNLQKGHMVRFYDPAWSTSNEKKALAIGDTFHYTNACPQIAKYNAGIWNDLEDYYMARAIFNDKRITVFTGPIMKGAKMLNGLLVPLSFWKIIVFKSEGKLTAMAFLITQKLVVEELEKLAFILEDRLVEPTLSEEDIERLYRKLKEWRVKIALIEEKTGLRFGLSRNDVFERSDNDFNEELSLKEPSIAESKKMLDLKAFAEQQSFDKELIRSL